MQIPPPPGDTAPHVLAVVLEVHDKQRLGPAVAPDPLVHLLPLLRGGHQLRGGVVANRHIVEVPGELGPPFHQLVHKFLRADGIQVGAGVAAGGAEGQLPGLQDLHGPADLLEYALAPAAVGGLLEPLHADGGDEVLHPEHLTGKILVNEGGVGKAQEFTVLVLVAQGDQVVLAHQRLAAGVDVDVNPQLFALHDDIVDLVEAQVQTIAVLRRPAPGAVQIAGGGGIQQDGPGDVAAISLPGLLLHGPANQVAVEHEVFKERPAHIAVHVRPHGPDQPVPVVVRIFDHPAERRPLAGEAVGAVSGEPVHPVHQPGDVGVRVLVQIAVGRAESCPLYVVHHTHTSHDPFFLPGLWRRPRASTVFFLCFGSVKITPLLCPETRIPPSPPILHRQKTGPCQSLDTALFFVKYCRTSGTFLIMLHFSGPAVPWYNPDSLRSEYRNRPCAR